MILYICIYHITSNKSKVDIFGWNKTKKQNQNSPTNQKYPYRIQFPIFTLRSLTTKCDVFCYSGWYQGLKEIQTQAPLSFHPVERGGKACGSWANQLLATWQDVWLFSLFSPGLPRTSWCSQCSEQRNRVHKTLRTGMWLWQETRTFCLFVDYLSRAKEKERRTNPTGERKWPSP